MTDLKAEQGALATRLAETIKDAMRARDRERVAALRQISAEFKKIEVDQRVAVSDELALGVLTKMVKQRKDSLTQFNAAGRDDLAKQEAYEIALIDEFLPQALTEAEVDDLIRAAIAATGAAGMKDMGKVMGKLRGDVTGRADMGLVSGRVKALLG